MLQESNFSVSRDKQGFYLFGRLFFSDEVQTVTYIPEVGLSSHRGLD